MGWIRNGAQRENEELLGIGANNPLLSHEASERISFEICRRCFSLGGLPFLLAESFLQLLLCGSVIISYFLGAIRGMALLLESLVFVVLFFSFIHYTNRAIILKQQNEEKQNTDKSDNE